MIPMPPIVHESCEYFNIYHIITLFGTCAYSRKTTFRELLENAGAPILYILQSISVCLYSSRGTCSLRGTCATKRNNMVWLFVNRENLLLLVCQYCALPKPYILLLQCKIPMPAIVRTPELLSQETDSGSWAQTNLLKLL